MIFFSYQADISHKEVFDISVPGGFQIGSGYFRVGSGSAPGQLRVGAGWFQGRLRVLSESPWTDP
jgi:hypothetical protein